MQAVGQPVPTRSPGSQSNSSRKGHELNGQRLAFAQEPANVDMKAAVTGVATIDGDRLSVELVDRLFSLRQRHMKVMNRITALINCPNDDLLPSAFRGILRDGMGEADGIGIGEPLLKARCIVDSEGRLDERNELVRGIGENRPVIHAGHQVDWNVGAHPFCEFDTPGRSAGEVEHDLAHIEAAPRPTHGAVHAGRVDELTNTVIGIGANRVRDVSSP
jgi:hypothetical protein